MQNKCRETFHPKIICGNFLHQEIFKNQFAKLNNAKKNKSAIFVAKYNKNDMEYKRLGDYIREVNVRNRELKVTKPMGINIDKHFMPSVANVIGTDLSAYKLVSKNQFACNLMHVGRDEKIPMAMQTDDNPIIVSPAYFVFEISQTEVLLPEYLMMWFSRPEFDRNAWFYTDADVRGGMDKSAFMDMMLPLPSIKRQREIVNEYETLTNRIHLNNQMIAKLEETAQTLYRNMFVEGIDKENLPEGWRRGKIQDICEVKDGTHDSPKPVECGFPLVTSAHLKAYSLLLEQTYNISKQDYSKINERSLVETKDILFSMIGTVGAISFVLYDNINFAVKNMAIFKTSQKIEYAEYIHYFLKSKEMNAYIEGCMSGSTQNYVTLNTLRETPIVVPNLSQVELFHKDASTIVSQIFNYTRENSKLTELQSLLLARMGQ